MRKLFLLYRDEETVSRYHEITVYVKKNEKSLAILGFCI